MIKDTKKLKQRILEEMSVDYANALERNFELAKQFIRVTSGGKVEVLVKEQLNGKQQILLYLIGKLYAKEAELNSSESAGNKELTEELGIPMGSLLPWLKDLRDQNKIKSVKTGYHQISVNLIEKTLKEIEKKVK
jgi:hypothetical protein